VRSPRPVASAAHLAHLDVTTWWTLQGALRFGDA